jgi:hypothetical protein
MTGERRYDEEEVAEIFRVATEERLPAVGGGGGVGPSGGLTLPEIQAIAREVGISTDLVARAALQIGGGGSRGTTSVLGVPIGVERVVELPRDLTELEWSRLVARLRETFQATGQVESSAGLRQWWNGNLRVLVEPTEGGYRLRMTTRRGDLGPLMGVGFGFLAMALVLLVVAGISGKETMAGALALSLMGIGTLGVSVARLPFWARTRARQMEEIAAEVTAAAALPPAGADSRGALSPGEATPEDADRA